MEGRLYIKEESVDASSALCETVAVQTTSVGRRKCIRHDERLEGHQEFYSSIPLIYLWSSRGKGKVGSR